ALTDTAPQLGLEHPLPLPHLQPRLRFCLLSSATHRPGPWTWAWCADHLSSSSVPPWALTLLPCPHFVNWFSGT
uniref:Uncharacterized protein n=1 Tax=Ursus americanus TaxID=9643 RepID=A0A452QHQ7_URSAM